VLAYRISIEEYFYKLLFIFDCCRCNVLEVRKLSLLISALSSS
jgi:hypothetical protein